MPEKRTSEALSMCLKGPPIEFFRICLPPRGKYLRKGLPLTEQNVSPSQLSTIQPKCRGKTLVVWRTPHLIPSYDQRKERLCRSPTGTQRMIVMCLTYSHGIHQRQSRMAMWNGSSVRHAVTMARPNGQRTQRTRERARHSTLRLKSPIARPVPGAPHHLILPGERRNVRVPRGTRREAFQLKTRNAKAGRALVGGKTLRPVLQIAVRLKTTMTFITDPNTR